jgi:hypothetical protein
MVHRIIKEKVMNEQNEQLKRIADVLEEILRLVKKDQEEAAARRRQYDNEGK